MSDFLSDQDILDLVGDLGNFMGLPGGTVAGVFEGAPSSNSAQHPLYPLTATFVTSGSSGVVTVGFPGERCILPTADGHSNLVANILASASFNVLPNVDPIHPRYDLVVGQAMRNTGLSGEAALGATFQYAPGPHNSSAPPNYSQGYAPVVQITVPPGATGLKSSDAQVVLPGLSFVTLAGSGSFTSTAPSGTALPLTAAVVTASPFNTPVIAGSAQGLIAPTQDAMASIQAALSAVGPGGAIYIPSGTYGVGSTATTLNGNIVSPLGQIGSGSGPQSGPLGQTIIFGGAVNFVALADVPAFVLSDGCVTVGAPKFWDVLYSTTAASGATAQTISGLGPYVADNVLDVQSSWVNNQYATVTDNFGNVLAGLITAVTSGAIGSITVDTTGPLLTTTTASITLSSVRSSYTFAVGDTTKMDVGQEIFIKGTTGWMTAFLTDPPSMGSITVESLAQSATGGFILTGAQVFRTYTIPSSTFGTIGGSGSASPLTVTVSNTLSSFAVQLSGKAETIDALYVDGWANGILMGPSVQNEPNYGTNGFIGGIVSSIRCDTIRGTGVQFAGKPNAHVEDTHIKQMRCGTGNMVNLGVCGIDIVSVEGLNVNALTIARAGALGFNGAIGHFTGNPTPNPAGISATGLSIRNLKGPSGGGPTNVRFAELFVSSSGTGIYLDAGCNLIDFGLFSGGGGGFGKTFTPPVAGVPSQFSGYSLLSNGASGNPVTAVSFGQSNFQGDSNSLYGLWLLNTQQFHCDFAIVGQKNQDGVRIDAGCSSIGFDHLILQGNGQQGGYGINAVGSPAPEYLSIDKLDLSMETAVSGAVNLGGAAHVSYNDMGTFPVSGATYLPAGYYNSDGGAPSGPVVHGFTAGVAGSVTPFAFAIANDNTGSTTQQTSIGTATGSVNTIVGSILKVGDLGNTPQTLFTLDASGNVGIAGGLYLSPGGVSITSGAGAPTAGSMPNGSLYLRTDGTTNNRLYVSDGTVWRAVGSV